MINLLSAFAHPTPYYAKLRPLAGSVTATILLVQLDYWFAKYPDGFFKFVEPCGHAAYKDGDSWTEELGFSKKEFSNAFSKIGIAYKSMTAFKEAGVNPFALDIGQSFYCSYHNKRTGQTYYLRNHQVLDAAIAGLFTVDNQRDSTVSDQRAPTVGDQSNGSVSDQRASMEMPIVDPAYTETTSRDQTETTNTPLTPHGGNGAGVPVLNVIGNEAQTVAQTMEAMGLTQSDQSGQDVSTGDVSEPQKGAAASQGKTKKSKGKKPVTLQDEAGFLSFMDWYDKKICKPYERAVGETGQARGAWAKLEGNNFYGVGRDGFRVGCGLWMQSLTPADITTIRHAVRFLRGVSPQYFPVWLDHYQRSLTDDDQPVGEFLPDAIATDDPKALQTEIQGLRAHRLGVTHGYVNDWDGHDPMDLSQILEQPELAREYRDYLLLQPEPQAA